MATRPLPNLYNINIDTMDNKASPQASPVTDSKMSPLFNVVEKFERDVEAALITLCDGDTNEVVICRTLRDGDRPERKLCVKFSARMESTKHDYIYTDEDEKPLYYDDLE